MKALYSPMDLAGAKATGDVAAGVAFLWGLASIEGAWFLLLHEPHHSEQDILAAKHYLQQNRDVVGQIRVAMPEKVSKHE